MSILQPKKHNELPYLDLHCLPIQLLNYWYLGFYWLFKGELLFNTLLQDPAFEQYHNSSVCESVPGIS